MATAESPAPETIGGREIAIATGIAFTALLLPYHRGLVFPFSLDDYTFLFQAAGIDPVDFSLRRWLAVRGYYELWLHVFGPNPSAWHVTSFVLHGANAVCVYALGRKLGFSQIASWTACGLFAASTVAFTAVYWAAGIQEIGSTFFLLCSIWCALATTRWRWASVPLFASAILCKESVLVAPLVLPLIAWVRNPSQPAARRRAWIDAALLLSVGLVIFIAAGLHHRMTESAADAPYAAAYDSTLLVNLATLFIWWAAPWRAYPDRVSGPEPSLVLPAVAAWGVLLVAMLVVFRAARRPVLVASAWFVALLLPVLPLVRHTYAYYTYAAQIGFLLLIGAGIERLVRRVVPGRPEAVPAAATLVVAVTILLAAHNTRTHENLTLPNSIVPHDSVVRYSRAAGALVAAIRHAHLPANVSQVGFMNFPEQLGTAGQTPGKFEPGMVRVRKFPLREALRDGKLFRLYFPHIEGKWLEDLTPELESPDMALFFTSGFDVVTLLPDIPQAYCLQAQGHVLAGDREAARHDLERALQIAPNHAPARLLLAGLFLESGDPLAARRYFTGLRREDVPEELRPFYDQVLKILGAEPAR